MNAQVQATSRRAGAAGHHQGGHVTADSPRTITADDLTTGISNAIKARDFEAVADMLTALSYIDQGRAQKVYDTIQAGIALGRLQRIPDADDLAARLKEATHDRR